MSFGSSKKQIPSETFSDLLKSPIKKRIRPVDFQEQEEEEEEEFPPEVNTWKPSELKDVKPWDEIKTGEEDEETVLNLRCKLFAWVKNDAGEAWKERGLGHVRINFKKGDENNSRLVMRADGILKVILNVKIIPNMPCQQRDEKYVELLACENPPQLTRFLFKFSNKDQAEELIDALQDVLKRLK